MISSATAPSTKMSGLHSSRVEGLTSTMYPCLRTDVFRKVIHEIILRRVVPRLVPCEIQRVLDFVTHFF